MERYTEEIQLYESNGQQDVTVLLLDVTVLLLDETTCETSEAQKSVGWTPVGP